MKAFILLLVVVVLAACTPSAAPTLEPASTSTLIPPTATLTAVPPSATPKTGNLPAPQDLETIVPPAATSAPTDSSDDATSLIDRDPIAAELVRLAQNQVATLTNLPTRRIQLTEVSAVMWTDSSLNCPLPDTVYLPVTSDGYRIVIEAAGSEYLFHTDIDRVVPCDPENEQLPDD